MSANMERSMVEKQSKSVRSKAMLAAITATDKARAMLFGIGGPLPWNGTRESWRYKVARAVGINPRRVKAIINHERIRLGADELLAIQAAHESMASLRCMAGDAEILASDPLTLGSRD